MTEQEDPIAAGARFKMVHAAVTAAVVLAVAALVVAVTRAPASASPTPAGCGGSAPHLSVQGTGQASGPPDQLDFGAQVQVSAGSAQAALAKDDATAAAVVRAVEAAGVPASDVQTTGLSINPNLAYQHGQTVVTGYGVSNDIAVTVRKIALAGSVIDAANTAGGNDLTIDGLGFVRSDPRLLQDKARQAAVRQAVTHAAAMARAAGERLASVCSLTDDSGSLAPQPHFAANGQAARAPLTAPPLEGGTQQASAQVTLVYALAPLNR